MRTRGAGGEQRRTNLNSFENRLSNQIKAKKAAKTPVGSSRDNSQKLSNKHQQAVKGSSMSFKEVFNFLWDSN
ncbi:MAG: hypothetical protein ACON35_05385 [Candidatus Marinamargulisbacteria bacterium]